MTLGFLSLSLAILIIPVSNALSTDSGSCKWDQLSAFGQPYLTIILPAYNEEDRINDTIDTYCKFLSESSIWKYNQTCSLLIVDDGSTDNTVRFAYSRRGIDVYSISLTKNEGKGSAISNGIAAVKEKYKDPSKLAQLVLIADADGSGDISYLNDMIKCLSDTIQDKIVYDKKMQFVANPWETKSIVVGNRNGNTSHSRMITRWGFKFLVKIICGDLGIDDTQTGFKLMTLDAGLVLYHDLNLKRWTHDVEVLYRAKILGVPAAEIPIGWQDKKGSKLANSLSQTIWSSARMLFEILWMKINYSIGRWKSQI